MKLLLDTHIFLWSLLEPTRITPQVASALEDPTNELWLSPITIWEVLVLAERRRVILNPDASTWIRSALKTVPVNEAPLNDEIAIQSRGLDLIHEDPVDRFLAATAIVYDLTLVTADERLLGSQRFSTLANK